MHTRLRLEMSFCLSDPPDYLAPHQFQLVCGWEMRTEKSTPQDWFDESDSAEEYKTNISVLLVINDYDVLF